MDAYKIGVSIALTNGVSPVLAIIGRDMLGLKPTIAGIENNFKGWATALTGVAAILGGTAILGGLAKIAEHGEKLLDQQDKLQRGGVSLADTMKLQAGYFNSVAKAIPTSTIDQYLKTVNELRAVTGSTEGAAALAPKAMQVDALLSNTLGSKQSGAYYKLLRSAEMKGIATDPARLEQFTDAAFSYITAFGGKLTPDDFQTIARRGGTAFMNADIGKALGPISVLGADLGGSGAGTALMTAQQLQLGASTLSKQQFGTLDQLGLIDKSKAHATGFGGGRMQLDPGAMTGSLEHSGDLPGWIHDVVWPAIVKEARGDKALEASLLAKIAPNRNAAKLIQMFGDEGFSNQIAKDLGLAGQVAPIGQAYSDFTSRNPKGVKEAFYGQEQSMMEAIGAPLMQAALPVMKGVTDMFTSIGSFANAHPEAVKYIGEAIAAMAAALIGFGAIALGSLIISLGAVPAAVGAVVAALGALAAFNWGTITSAISAFVDFLVGIGGKIKGFFADPHPETNKDFIEGLKHPTNFNPGARQSKPSPISLSLNVDGRALAQAVADQQDSLYGFPTGAPAANGVGRYASGDHNYADV